MKKYIFVILASSVFFYSSCKEKDTKIKNEVANDSLLNNTNIDSIIKIDTPLVENKIDSSKQVVHKQVITDNKQIDKAEKSKVANQKSTNKKNQEEKTTQKVKEVNKIEEINTDQNKENLNENKYEKAAIYTGCENEALKGNQFALDCLSKRLSINIQNELRDFIMELSDTNNSGLLSTKLSFEIDTEGKIVNITTEGDDSLGKAGIKALNNITNKQIRRGITIKPSLDKNNKPVSMKLNIPVKINLQ